ncbi:hypothetical protein NIES4071_50650 [Calothrix sp. NIES-4071]|nr:hypothetical protein NIES4071_50650 [Calothrix sp. NIES-4071]BAZ59373.1 hypothetical protein NIES4105_50600 [Calothrix sp. NIES-4105]
MIEELINQISQIRLHLILGATSSSKQQEENHDWEG